MATTAKGFGGGIFQDSALCAAAGAADPNIGLQKAPALSGNKNLFILYFTWPTVPRHEVNRSAVGKL
jgi:hypothetical protein